MKRNEVEAKYKWKLEDIYASDELFEADLKKLNLLIPMLDFRATMLTSAESLLGALEHIDTAALLSDKLYVYSKMRRDEDNSNAKYQSMCDRALSAAVELGAQLSYVNPLLLSAGDTLKEFLDENEQLRAKYDFYLNDLLRAAPHVLSEKEELLLSRSHDFSSGAKEIFTMLNNADLTFGSVKDEKGETIELSHGKYIALMQSKDRRVRKDTFETYYSSFEAFKNTIAAAYATSVKKDVFYAQAKKFSSSREHALFSDNVPLDVYDNLISVTRDNLSTMHRYLALRKRALKVDTLNMYDIYVPLCDVPSGGYDYEKSVQMVIDGLAPLGESYISILIEAFASGWVDVVETKGKTSGAYSWGVYGTHPYVLLNHRDDLDSVFTIAHEMGHAMHSYHSNAAQPYSKSGYSIFVAEVASTVNEILLTQYLLRTEKNAELRKHVLNHYLDQFRTTVFRQVMFAEFEKISHEMAEQKEPLTAESLSEAYAKLNADYYGKEVVQNEQISFEWARIPHFYNAFYVYKYATGFSAAVAIVKRLLEKGTGAVKDYLAFLSSGGSDYPLNELKITGVDLQSGACIQTCMAAFKNALDEFEKLV